MEVKSDFSQETWDEFAAWASKAVKEIEANGEWRGSSAVALFRFPSDPEGTLRTFSAVFSVGEPTKETIL